MSFHQRFGLTNLVVGAALFSAASADGPDAARWLALVQIICGVIGFLFTAPAPEGKTDE